MAFRRRERPLSPEELQEKILKEITESWLHSEPHFGFSPNGSIYPLSKQFQSEISVLFLLDAGDYITERVYEFLAHLKHRYPRLPWFGMISFGNQYLFLKNPKFFDRYKSFTTYHQTPVMIDSHFRLDGLYKIEGAPTAVFFNRGHDINRLSLGQNFEAALTECERILQTVLRMNDRGLPLPPVTPLLIAAPIDNTRLTVKDVHAEGNWAPGENSIVTDDPKATITIQFEGTQLRLICSLHPQARDGSKLHVTLGDKAVPQNLCGSNLKPDDKGHSVVEIVRNQGIYELINSTTPVRGVLKIHFVSVIENPAVFYGLRSASSAGNPQT